jgi:hypothetical protein
MSKNSKFLITVIVIILVVVLVGVYISAKKQSTDLIPPPANTYGLSQYTDPTYGFSFWYPSALKVSLTTTNDSKSFPGGVAVETLLVGEMGSTSVVVVNSSASTITDEPDGHASPISQTKYSYDTTSNQWMISYPEGTPTGQGSATPTPADISKTTISGLYMLPSGKRFDTTIVPLSTTQFLVISDGGGSSFTSELAKTISQNGASIDAEVEATALQAEATAYVPN